VHPRPPLPPGPYLIVGLGRSGAAAAKAIKRGDPRSVVRACDARATADLRAQAGGLERIGVEVELNTDEVDLTRGAELPRTIVKSPGVRAGAPAIRAARELGLEIIGELELGWRLLPNDFVAVTGTNGKTTTAEMIAAIHRKASQPAIVAGNVGAPLSSLAGSLQPDTTVVCEVSSFQLEDSSALVPEVGVLLNVSEDHLDRHHTFDDYLNAKLRLFSKQGASDFAVLNADDSTVSGAQIPGAAARVWFGSRDDCDLRLQGDDLVWRGHHLMKASQLSLRGAHNLANAMAAACASLVREIDTGAVADALSEFRAAQHRLEFVATIDDVDYVNDSKATNVAAAAAALRSFDAPVHAILGGSAKGGDFVQLAPVVSERCAACYLIGEAAGRLANDLGEAGVELLECGELERALLEAQKRAVAGEAVVLAPACASFDDYDNYEQRGEHFRALVGKLEREA
jgi:UDP-N-acetylmuramoylalanine--D-glutamate ligase